MANWLCACVSLRRSRNIKAKARKASSAWSALNQNTEGIRWRNSFQRPFLIARGYRAIAQFSGLGGPFMTGTRVAEFVRMRQKAYRLARLNALTEVFGSMWLIGPERLLGVLNGVGAVLHVFQDVISGRGPVQDFSGLLAGETLIDRQAHPAAAASGVHLHE